MEAVFEFIRSLLPNVDFGILAGADILNLTSVNNIKAFHLVIRILSWAALAVSLLSFIFLRWLASRRGTKEDLSANIISAVVAVILTSRTGQLHWWVIVSPCLSIYVLMYPFRYLRVYFKKLMMVVYVGLCILFAGNYAISTLQVYLPKFKLIALAMWLVACGASGVAENTEMELTEVETTQEQAEAPHEHVYAEEVTVAGADGTSPVITVIK